MQKNYSSAKAECICEIVKKNCGIFPILKFPFFRFKLNILQGVFFLFSLFLLLRCVKKNIFVKEIWVIGLVSKIDAIDGKKWVKFVAMQQNSETLINDLKHIERYSGELS